MKLFLSVIWGSAFGAGCFMILTLLNLNLADNPSRLFGTMSGEINYSLVAFIFGFFTTLIATRELARKTLTFFLIVLAISAGQSIGLVLKGKVLWQDGLAHFIVFMIIGSLLVTSFLLPSWILEAGKK